MSVSTELSRLQTAKSALASSITSKGVTVPAGTKLDVYATLVDQIAQGGGSVSPSDINFYDYDGTLVAAWPLSELPGKTALPDNPTHDGLTAQGWNWTLAQLKTKNAKMDVGQMYVTSDGKTRLHIRIAAPGRMTVPLYISQTVENGVSIDWGDGSASQTLAGTGNVNATHTYAAIGDYIIILTVTSGTLGFGDGTSSHCVLGGADSNSSVYSNMLQNVYIGSSVTSIGTYAFYTCYSLSNVTIPSGVTSIGDYAFQSCHSLTSITIPSGVTSIRNYAFQNCYSLSNVTIPSGVTSIGDYAFQSCHSLTSITIPSGVTSIGYSAFYYCYSLASVTIPSSVNSIINNAFNSCNGVAEYHLLPTNPPTLGNTYVFTGIASDCKIYVPASSLSAYKAATNWSTYASYMVGE